LLVHNLKLDTGMILVELEMTIRVTGEFPLFDKAGGGDVFCDHVDFEHSPVILGTTI